MRGHGDITVSGELDGVAEKVEKDLLQAVVVGVDQHLFRHRIVQINWFVSEQWPDQCEHPIHKTPQIHLAPAQLQVFILKFGKVEDVVHQAGKTPAAADDQIQILACRLVHRPADAVQQ